MDNDHYLVPLQTTGVSKDLDYTAEGEDTDDAGDWFVDAKDRLLAVNKWHELSAGPSASFQLTDGRGRELQRKAHSGDYIRIDLPGPGSPSGGGYDWVHIEAIEYDDYPDEDRETIAMRVRPCQAPLPAGNADTAHFFSTDATSTFVVERQGKKLRAHYHGRNETANTDGNLVDKVRNAAVAAGAWLGLSDVQWQGLVKGLLV